MKKLLFVAVLLTAGFVEQVTASTDSIYLKFQNSLVALVKVSKTLGVPDFQKFIELLSTLSSNDVNISLSNYIPVMKKVVSYRDGHILHNRIVYHTDYGKEFNLPHLRYDTYIKKEWYITPQQFISSNFINIFTDFINIANSLEITSVENLIVLLEKLANTKHNMLLDEYINQITGVAIIPGTKQFYPSAAITLPLLVKIKTTSNV